MNKYLKECVLELKKADLELIRAKNMKVLCKNTDTARASNNSKPISDQRAWHGPCLQPHSRTTTPDSLLLLLLLRQAAYLVYF